MNAFTFGLLLGLGISLLFAPQPGNETRRMLVQRLRSMGNTQDTDHLPTAQELAMQASAQGMTVPEYDQQMASNEP